MEQERKSSHGQIFFLREQKDHRLFRSLEPACQAALVRFLEKCWDDFAVVYRAADRNASYAGLLKVLAGPFNQEWFPDWIVHWQIVAPEPPLEKGRYPLDRYVLQVQKLQLADKKK